MPYLDASIASILGQTFEDFELVVLENGSTDGSSERIAWWAARDPRITVHHAVRRLGGAGSSRAVVQLAPAPLIARMDADDVSHPARFERQVAAMREHPDAVLVATLHDYLDARGNRARGRDRWPLRTGTAPMPFCGGCLMFRRTAYEQVGGYRDVRGTWEDLDLCVRLSRAGRVLVIPQALYSCRFSPTSRTASAAVAAAVDAAAARTAALEPHRAGSADVAAGALLELNAMQLWAGIRPPHLAALRDHARGCATPRRLVLLAWAAWAQRSPASLRAALRWRSRLRDRLAGAWVPETRPREWRPG